MGVRSYWSFKVCVIKEKANLKNNVWTELAKTEVVGNSNNPKFALQIEIVYYFERSQPLQFLFYDSNDDNEITDVSAEVFFIHKVTLPNP